MTYSTDMTRAQRMVAEYDRLYAERSIWDSRWQDIAEYLMPHRSDIKSVGTQADQGKQDRLFDTSGIDALHRHSAGCVHWLTPIETPWFAFEAPAALKDNDDAKQWYAYATQVAQLELARSNFYSAIQTAYMDRAGLGTALLMCRATADEALAGSPAPMAVGEFVFETWKVGSYCIALNAFDQVDTVYRCYSLTALQAEQRFGREKLPDAIKECLQPGSKKLHDKHEFLQVIKPRTEVDPDAIGVFALPFASYHIHKTSRQEVGESGFHELPFFATRFRLWESDLWGDGPGSAALGDIRQVNILQEDLDVMAEVASNPRILLPKGHSGAVDLRANGFTFFSDPQMKPQEWLTGGQYPIGIERVQSRQEAIRRHFFLDMFEMFAQLEKQMTATEARERAEEKIAPLSATFARMTTELFNPLLQRVFGILLRRRKFGQIPKAVVQQIDQQGFGIVPSPQVIYTSKLALAQRAIHSTAFARAMERVAPIIEIRPEILDNYRLDRAERDLARADGMHPDHLASEAEISQIREERARALQQQAEMEAAQQAMPHVAKAVTAA